MMLSIFGGVAIVHDVLVAVHGFIPSGDIFVMAARLIQDFRRRKTEIAITWREPQRNEIPAKWDKAPDRRSRLFRKKQKGFKETYDVEFPSN